MGFWGYSGPEGNGEGVWMADPVTYSCVYLIIPVDLSVLRHMKMVTLDYTYKYTGGD